MLSKILSSMLRERRRNAPSLRATRNEAASQYEAKRAKLDTAVDAVFTDSLRRLDRDERERVATYMESKVPGLANANERKGTDDMGDFIVCDDYRKGMGTLSVAVMGLVMTAGIGAACFALWVAMWGHEINEPVVPVDTNTRYESRIEIGVE